MENIARQTVSAFAEVELLERAPSARLVINEI
jgi:hypothetical protein